MFQPRLNEDIEATLLADWLMQGNARKFFVIMGVPASGKSTLCDRLVAKGAIRINRDEIRERENGDASKLGDNKAINRLYYAALRDAFSKGGVVISDNVNLNFFHRKGSIAAAREAGYTDIVCVWVDVPLEVALARNAARSRHVPEQVIRDMYASIGEPTAEEGDLVVLHNGSDSQHYRIAKVRTGAADGLSSTNSGEPNARTTSSEASMPDTSDSKPTAGAPTRKDLVGDLHTQVKLLDACVAAGRDEWAATTLGVIRTLAESGITLFTTPGGTTGTDPGKGTGTGGRRKTPWVPPTPEQVTEVLLRMIDSMPVVTHDGPLVMLSFNGHLLTADKAKLMMQPLLELVKRAHVIFFQESNVDALRLIGKAARYGLNASHRNKREQACGMLYHPRLQWIGSDVLYHDYLLDVPGHPEYKETMRPAVQRRVLDATSGLVIDLINFHGKSNLGGPDQTRPVRRWQFEQLVAHLEGQKTASPWQPREVPGGGKINDELRAALAAATTLPLGAVVLGGDYNAPIEKPETTEIEPLVAGGFARVSTPDLRWSYQYRGNGGQFDGFFVRDLGAEVTCFIPPFSENKRDAAFYRELSDHMPVFMTVPVPAKPAASQPAESAHAEVTTGDGSSSTTVPADAQAPVTPAANAPEGSDAPPVTGVNGVVPAGSDSETPAA